MYVVAPLARVYVMVKGHHECKQHIYLGYVTSCNREMFKWHNLKQLPKLFTEPISIFIYICAKFHDLIPLLGMFQKSKLLLGL